MENISDEMINAITNEHQNNIDDLFDRDKKSKEKMIDSILNAKQNNIDDLVHQNKKNEEEMIDSILNAKQNNIDNLFYENQNKNKKIEEEYRNSSNYHYYSLLVNHIDNLITYNIPILKKEYENKKLCRCYFNKKDIVTSVLISNIGFPIPEKYIEDLDELLKIKIQDFNDLEDSYYDAHVQPVEYIERNAKILKRIGGYYIVFEIKKIPTKKKIK